MQACYRRFPFEAKQFGAVDQAAALHNTERRIPEGSGSRLTRRVFCESRIGGLVVPATEPIHLIYLGESNVTKVASTGPRPKFLSSPGVPVTVFPTASLDR